MTQVKLHYSSQVSDVGKAQLSYSHKNYRGSAIAVSMDWS